MMFLIAVYSNVWSVSALFSWRKWVFLSLAVYSSRFLSHGFSKDEGPPSGLLWKSLVLCVSLLPSHLLLSCSYSEQHSDCEFSLSFCQIKSFYLVSNLPAYILSFHSLKYGICTHLELEGSPCFLNLLSCLRCFLATSHSNSPSPGGSLSANVPESQEAQQVSTGCQGWMRREALCSGGRS